MIHNADYVKGLMRKRFDGTIPPMESALLRVAHRVYEEEEWLRMTAEALEEMDRAHDGGLPKGRPMDPAAIRRTADKERRSSVRAATWKRVAVAATILAILGWGVKKYWDDRFGPLRVYGDCTVPSDGMIPSTDFGGTVYIGDAPPAVVGTEIWGNIGQVGNLSIDRDTSGIVVISKSRKAKPTETGLNAQIRISTGKGEQLGVRLPGGTQVRLNEGATLTYPLPRAEAIGITGIAYVQVPPQENKGQVTLQTANSRIYSHQADLVVVATEKRTGLTLLEGGAGVISLVEKKEGALRVPGDLVSIETGRTLGGAPTEMMLTMHSDRVGNALQWTRAVREFRDVPLYEFIKENERRFNIRFSDLNCLPKGKRVSAALCYRASVADFLAVIQKHGVLVYEKNGQYTLCDPKTGKRWSRSTITAQVVNHSTCVSCSIVR